VVVNARQLLRRDRRFVGDGKRAVKVKKIARAVSCMCKADGRVGNPKRVVLSKRFFLRARREDGFTRGDTLKSQREGPAWMDSLANGMRGRRRRRENSIGVQLWVA
jgi:hypothetical protein